MCVCECRWCGKARNTCFISQGLYLTVWLSVSMNLLPEKVASLLFTRSFQPAISSLRLLRRRSWFYTHPTPLNIRPTKWMSGVLSGVFKKCDCCRCFVHVKPLTVSDVSLNVKPLYALIFCKRERIFPAKKDHEIPTRILIGCEKNSFLNCAFLKSLTLTSWDFA